MEYEDCRIMELINHAAREDAKAQALLVEELRCYVRGLVVQQVLSRARRDYGQFWDSNSEFGAWIDRILQREVEAACCSANRGEG
jgi:hypothetical protein